MTRLIHISPHTAIPLLVACFGLFLRLGRRLLEHPSAAD